MRNFSVSTRWVMTMTPDNCPETHDEKAALRGMIKFLTTQLAHPDLGTNNLAPVARAIQAAHKRLTELEAAQEATATATPLDELFNRRQQKKTG